MSVDFFVAGILGITFCEQAPAGFGRSHSRLAGKTFESKFTIFAAQNKREAHHYSAAKNLWSARWCIACCYK
jgi:hypothetical protein